MLIFLLGNQQLFIKKTFKGASAFNNGFPAGSAGTATISNTLDWNMPNLGSHPNDWKWYALADFAGLCI